MRDFIIAALPCIVTGLALAVLFMGRASKKKKEEAGSYEAEGMSIGMCIGVAISPLFSENIGIGMSLGMLIGLVIGMCIKKE